MLGDEYISQHVMQGYREYLEQTSYKIYMSSMVRGIATALGGNIETSWNDILNELDESASYKKPQTESEEEIKTRLLSKLNGREGA